MNTCGNCVNWRLQGPLAVHGFGHCAARPDPDKRAAITTPAQTTCRIGLFQAKKQDDATPIHAPPTQTQPAAQEGPC